MTRIGVVGAGRVGTVLAAALRAAGHEVVAVSGDSTTSRERAAALLPGVPILKPSAVARDCDLLLVTVPDDMLANVVDTLCAAGAIRAGQSVVHTSGRHGLDVLAPAQAVGARVLAMHPGLTFTGTATDLPRVPGCVFAITASDADLAVAEQLVRDLGASSIVLPEAMRTLYHAGMVHGSNHLVTLVAEALEILASAGADDPAAALRPLLTAALDNALESGDAALTGPIVRGDLGTVAAHLEVLQAETPRVVDTYVALARATADRAALDGRLPSARRASMETLLGAAR